MSEDIISSFAVPPVDPSRTTTFDSIYVEGDTIVGDLNAQGGIFGEVGLSIQGDSLLQGDVTMNQNLAVTGDVHMELGNLYANQLDITGPSNFFNINVQGDGSTVSFVDKLNVNTINTSNGAIGATSISTVTLDAASAITVQTGAVASQIPYLISSKLANFKTITIDDAPINANDGVNKEYVDSAFSGAIPNLSVGLFSMFNNNIGTQVTLVGNRQKILTGGTITTFNGGSFTISTSNRLTFTGPPLTRLLVSYELTATHNGSPSVQFQTVLYANGIFQTGFSDVSLDQGAMNVDGTNIGTRTFFGEAIANFTSGSYVEVWVVGFGDVVTFTAQSLKIKAVRC